MQVPHTFVCPYVRVEQPKLKRTGLQIVWAKTERTSSENFPKLHQKMKDKRQWYQSCGKGSHPTWDATNLSL